MAQQKVKQVKKLKTRATGYLRYKSARPDVISDKRANEIGIRIEKIKDRNGNGIVTPNDIIQDAKDIRSPYHKLFTWDDTIAAQRHREHEARSILGAIIEVRTIGNEQVDVRAFVNVIGEEGNRGYASIKEVRIKPQLMNQVIADALKEAKRWNQKWRVYQELQKITRAIDETLSEYENSEDR